jgi:hypothetical protein
MSRGTSRLAPTLLGLLLLPAARSFVATGPRPSATPRAAAVRAAESASPDDVPDISDDLLQKDLRDTLQMKEFNNELYAHLNKRPEYETSELYSQLRKRQDVDDPLYSELESRREMLANAPLPNEEQTPGEVIELVLRALRDVDWPREGHGVEVLQNYSGPASILGEDRPDVTAQMLLDYFASSKYAILLDWVAIQYLRKLELSMDKNRALQQLRLTSNAGDSVSVTFQLSKYPTEQGSVWLIDQLLVKS